MSPGFGDIVDVQIKGVRVVNHPSARLIRIADEHGDVFDMPPQAAIVRVAPALWPPRPGDVWDDGFPFGGSQWFAREHAAKPDDPDQSPKIEMVSVAGDRDSLTPHALLKHAVEVTLAFRPMDGDR